MPGIETKRESLPQTLGLADVFCISVGAMVSAGIFLLPGRAFAHVGPAVAVSYVFGGCIATLGILAVLELATAMPRAGGIYYFATRSLGPLAGTMSGLLNWAALALKGAFAIFGTAQIAHAFGPAVPVPAYGVALTAVFLFVNLLSTAAAAKMQQLLVAVLLLVMAAYVALGAGHVELARFAPFVAEGKRWSDVLWEAGFLFVSFGGLLGVVSVAEEVRNPRRNIPLGILAGLGVTTALYGLTMAVTVGAIDAGTLAASEQPLAEAARHYYGRAGFAALTLGALLAFVTTGNAGLMGAARYPVALARDEYAPAIFARTVGPRRVPVPALLLTGAVVAAVQFLDLETIVKVASTVVMLSYVLTNLAVVILRESGVMNYQPSFRTPLYPALPLGCMMLFALLVVKQGDASLGVTGGIMAFSILLYMRYGLKARRETALQQLVGRMAKPDFEAAGLEAELREVVRTRDGLVEDAFDRAVAQAPTFLLPGSATLDELFDEAAKLAASATGADADALRDRLLERERSSSTVIAPGVAVPHLVLPGAEGRFLVVIAKCEDGVPFGEDAPAGAEEPVRTAVFLFASEDRRGAHLRSLAMVAQTILAPGFAKRWLRARTPQQLRDIFLLARRTRASRAPAP